MNRRNIPKKKRRVKHCKIREHDSDSSDVSENNENNCSGEIKPVCYSRESSNVDSDSNASRDQYGESSHSDDNGSDTSINSLTVTTEVDNRGMPFNAMVSSPILAGAVDEIESLDLSSNDVLREHDLDFDGSSSRGASDASQHNMTGVSNFRLCQCHHSSTRNF